MKDKGGGWTGPAFIFTAEQENEIRRAFGDSFPEAGISAFLRSVAGALTKVANDRKELKTDPRAARARAEKVAALLSEGVAEISRMTETERDVFSLANWSDPVALEDLAATLEKAATGFRKAADGHALQRGEKVAGPEAASMFVAAQAAVAWRESFAIEPVDHDKADFVTVLDTILDAAGLPALGSDAIRTAIQGPPKKRK